MYEANYTTAQVEYVNVRNSLYLWVEQLKKLTFQILHEFVYFAFQKRLHLVPHWRSVQHNKGKSWNSLARYCWWFVRFVFWEFSTIVSRHMSWFRSDLTHRLPVMTDVVLAGNMTAQEYLDSVKSTIGTHKQFITHICARIYLYSCSWLVLSNWGWNMLRLWSVSSSKQPSFRQELLLVRWCSSVSGAQTFVWLSNKY